MVAIPFLTFKPSHLTTLMFKRVILEEWASIVPMIAFAVLALVFIVATIRALKMKPGDREHLSRMPLSDEPESKSEANESRDHHEP
ncbi:hypothetical protein [Haloferula sp. BvORR071]|uniref:hypothetical protein n=1 Tax=Haloferula sp. BvORR071 TaxID=1396141 RepID=UPI002240F681|nr:hypothetical protein [Haloferula sp. BvORR071]